MKKALFAVASAAAVFGWTGANAAVLTPVSVQATSTFPFFGQYSPEDLINGSGLTDEGLHDSNYDNMWLTDQSDQQAQLTFDLGGTFDLSSVDIWQFNFGTNTPVISTLDRGVKQFRVLLSMTGDNFAEVFSGTLQRSPDGSPIAAQSFGIAGTARYVMIDILNNYAQGTFAENDTGSGLSEVRFQGVAAADVPEPAALGSLFVGLGLLGVSINRRRRAANA